MQTSKVGIVRDDSGAEWLDINDPANWESGSEVPHEAFALAGPTLTPEQFSEEIRKGDESGCATGNPVKRILQELRQGRSAAA